MARDDVVVGFIGLGIMGGRMAANLQKAGYKLVVHDLQRQAASHHLNAGAAWAENPRALAGRSDVIFSSLPEPPDVEAVALGPDGLIAGMKPGTAYFDLSTNSPSVVKKLHAAHDSSALRAYNLLSFERSSAKGVFVPVFSANCACRNWKLPEFDTASTCGGTADLRRKRGQGRIES